MVCVAAAVLSGCAAAPIQRTEPTAFWDLKSVAGSRSETVPLRSVDPQTSAAVVAANVSAADAQTWLEVFEKMQEGAGQRVPTLVLDNRTVFNASATLDKQGQPVVLVSLPIFDALAMDRDAIAALLGHEIAHIKLGHLEAARTRQQIAGAVRLAGFVAGFFIPYANAVTSLATGTAVTAFSRDQEREADDAGLRYAVAAGYDAQGGVRLMEILQRQPSAAVLPFLSTHPGKDERLEAMRKAAQSR
jgi:predicted Zn-dependent protease